MSNTTGIDASMDMSQLMSSFQSTRITDDDRKMMASTETMGTIEPIAVGNGDESIADMSLATMNSSTFSILKGDDSVLGLGASPAVIMSNAYGRLPSGGSSTIGTGIGSERSSFGGNSIKQPSDSSLNIYDLTSSLRSTPGSGLRRSVNSTGLAGVKEEDADPRVLDESLGLGSSSLSMLKGMVMSSDDVAEQDDSEQQQDQYTSPRKPTQS